MKNVLYVGNALSQKGKTKTSVETLGVLLKEICNIKRASNKSNKLLRLLDMCVLVLKNRKAADYVLIDTYSTSNFYYALVVSQLCRFLRLNYIPILHGGNLENRLKNSSRPSKLIFKNAYKLISPSNFLKTKFNDYGYNEVEFIPNCIEIKNYEFLDRPIEAIKLLWVRGFSRIYNPQMALYVLKGLLEKGYKTELCMVGPDVDGSIDALKKLNSELNLSVRFTGKLTKSEWRELSKDYNVFINTTNFDNTPISVIEAMALGMPVVSTNVGGMPFLIEDEVDGLLVQKANVDQMVAAILKIKHSHQLRTALVTKARQKVEAFDWNSVKQSWNEVLA